jgi:vacuolar-type H+-ATPase subunit E/Vma4
MKLDKIAQSILAEAEVEREKIISSAKNEAKLLLDNKHSELEGLNLEKLTHFEQDIEKMVIENVASKRLKAKRDVQIAKDQVISKTLKMVKEKLYEIKKDEKRYTSLLKKLFSEAIEEFNGDEYEVLCSKEDEKIVKGITKSDVKISKDKISGGFILKSKKKRMSVDYTFDTLLRDKENQIKEVISKNIF